MLFSKQTPAAGGDAFAQFDAAWCYNGNGYIFNDTGTSIDVRIGDSGSVQTVAAGKTLPIALVFSMAELYVRRTDQSPTQVTVEATVGLNAGAADGGGGGTSGPITAANITDAGTAGKAVLQAETQAQALEAVGGAPWDPTEITITHSAALTEGAKVGSASSSGNANRITIKTGLTPNSTIAQTITYTSAPLSPLGSAENARNLDGLTVLSFIGLPTAVGANAVFRCGHGKLAAEAAGDWGVVGYGFVVRNLAISGWYYRAGALTEVALNSNAVVGSTMLFSIARTADGITWYINGVAKASTAIGSIGVAATNSSWRYEITNGADAADYKWVVSPPMERIVSPNYSGDFAPLVNVTDVSGLTSLEVGGYKTQTIAGAKTFSAHQPIADASQDRVYFIPKGSQAAVTSPEIITGIKLFGTDFIADQANYDDFGIYNAPQGLTFNSKRLGTGAVKSFLFVDQDTTPFVKVDVVSREVELLLAGKGLVMKSPDGTRYRITVANGGALSATAV